MRLRGHLTDAAAKAGARLFLTSFGMAVLFVMGMAGIPMAAAPPAPAVQLKAPLPRRAACVPWGQPIDLVALDAWRFGPSHPSSPGLFSPPTPPCP